MNRITDSRIFIAGIPLLFFLLLSAGSEAVIYLGKERQLAREKEAVLKEAGRVRMLLESEINTTLNLALGLVIYVASKPDVNQDAFASIARRLMRRTPHIRNIALAKDNIISHMYPMEGNEAALGLRYMDNPVQRPGVVRAMESRRTVVAGPVELVQGGRGFISRSPIYLSDSAGTYWGLVSMVMDVDSLYTAGGMMDAGPLRYALKGKDGMGLQGEVFYGDAALFSDPDGVYLPIILPLGTWVLAAAPYRGASAWKPEGLMRLGGLSLALFMTAMLYALLRSLYRIRYLALHDPVTALPNIRYFEAYIKQLITVSLYKDEPFALFYIDLDHFKAINEKYGHKGGDAVLRDAASRLGGLIQEKGVACRMAGDEFVVILKNVQARGAADEKAEEMTRTLMAPYILGGRDRVTIKASVGVSFFPGQGVTSEILIREADLDLSLRKRKAALASDGTSEP